jgi:NCS1 family nucleobase:cation symporter-1
MSPEPAAWQSRVLTDAELAQVLAKASSLESMDILQKQLELRASTRGQVGREVDEDFVVTEANPIIEIPQVVSTPAEPMPADATRSVPIADETAPAVATPVEPVAEPEAAPAAAQVAAVVAPAAPAVAPAASIADSLNALFANRQRVTFDAAPALEVKPVAHVVPATAEVPVVEPVVAEAAAPEPAAPPAPVFASPATDPYPPTEPGFLSSRSFAPEPVSSDTQSVFIPTFTNPVPPEGFTGIIIDSPEVEARLGVEVSETQNEVPNVQEAEVANQVSAVLDAIDLANSAVESGASGSESAESGQVATAEQPVNPEYEAQAAQIPSAEEAITAFEETFLTEPQPTLVDDVIASVSAAVANAPMAPEPEEPYVAPAAAVVDPLGGYRSPRSLLATWNGNGILLLLAATGFIAATNKASLLTTVSAAFVALAISGFGFGTAALAARRGRQPQAVLSRAVFGVNGAAIPLTVVILARLAATATIALLASQALNFFYPMPTKLPLNIGGYQVPTSILVVVVLLIIGAVTAGFNNKYRYRLAAVFAYTSVGAAVVAIVAGLIANPAMFAAGGAFDFSAALGLASAIVILVGIIWGTSAADESPDLAPTTAVPKLIAASLLNFEIVGLLSVVAGYVFANLSLGTVGNYAVGAVFAVVLIVSFANQLRRNTDAFRGFGLQSTPGWLLVLVLVVIAGAAVGISVIVSSSQIWFGFAGFLPVVGVPVLAWLATLGVDTVLRREDFHEISLVRNYGFYGKVRLANLIGWLVATAVGWGFISSSVAGFGWLGYLAGLLGVSNSGLQSNMGLWLAMGIGAVTPLIFTIPKIREQEAEGLALEERRRELIDVLGIVE